VLLQPSETEMDAHITLQMEEEGQLRSGEDGQVVRMREGCVLGRRRLAGGGHVAAGGEARSRGMKLGLRREVWGEQRVVEVVVVVKDRCRGQLKRGPATGCRRRPAGNGADGPPEVTQLVGGKGRSERVRIGTRRSGAAARNSPSSMSTGQRASSLNRHATMPCFCEGSSRSKER
jgi:hypothetical protein